MRRKGLLLVIVMLAIASLMAAMAYNNATIQNHATLKIAPTDTTLLAVIPNPDANAVGNKDLTGVVNSKGVAEFTFGKGYGGTDFGLQPGSFYKWDKLFSVKNNSNETIEVMFKLPMESFGEYISIQGNNSTWFSHNQGDSNRDGIYGYGAPFTLAPNEQIDFRVDIGIPQDETFYGEGPTELGTFNYVDSWGHHNEIQLVVTAK
jgi:hypothetical protein